MGITARLEGTKEREKSVNREAHILFDYRCGLQCKASHFYAHMCSRVSQLMFHWTCWYEYTNSLRNTSRNSYEILQQFSQRHIQELLRKLIDEALESSTSLTMISFHDKWTTHINTLRTTVMLFLCAPCASIELRKQAPKQGSRSPRARQPSTARIISTPADCNAIVARSDWEWLSLYNHYRC